jgi:hypothetical protein
MSETIESFLYDEVDLDDVINEETSDVKNEALEESELIVGPTVENTIKELRDIEGFAESSVSFYIEEGRLELSILFSFPAPTIRVNEDIADNYRKEVEESFHSMNLDTVVTESEVVSHEDLRIYVNFA